MTDWKLTSLWEAAQTQFVLNPPEHHESHDIGGILEVVETRLSALIKLSVAWATPKAPVPQFASFSPFSHVRRFAVWTADSPHLPRCECLHFATARHKLGWFLTEPNAVLP